MQQPVGLVPRNCRTLPYTPRSIPEFQIATEFIAYASPESTYAVTRDFFRQARESILIGIYDFTASYIRDLLLEAIQRGVKVTLMVDLDRRKGESELWQEIADAGGEAVPAPSCASRQSRYFPSCHEKVIVIDGEWTLVQSGNYSPASIPCNEVDGGDPQNFISGNRDMGVAIRSRELAAFFTDILHNDIRLELDGAQVVTPAAEAVEPELSPLFEMPAPQQTLPQRYRSRRYNPRLPLRVVPVISPENYLEVVTAWLASAQQSIYIEQQYIRPHQPHIQRLLSAIQTARERNPRLNVRIVLAPPHWGELEKERQALLRMGEFGLKPGRNVRYLNPDLFVHCHNKLIIVDRKTVLISSQNWSDTAVSENREAGLLLYAPVLARYYARLFGMDWVTALPTLDTFRAPAPSAEMVTGSIGDYIEV